MIYTNNSSSKNIIFPLFAVFGLLYLISDIPGYHHSSHVGHSSHLSHHLFNKKIIGTSFVIDYMIFNSFENSVEKNFYSNNNPDYMTYDFYYYINDREFQYPEYHDKYRECIYFNTYKNNNNNNNTVFNFENLIISNDYSIDNLYKYKYNCYTYTKTSEYLTSYLFNSILFVILLLAFISIIGESCCPENYNRNLY